jgi:hypothetical protein
MKNLLVSIFALAALFMAPGCSKPAPPPVKFPHTTPFSLKLGQTGESSLVPGFTILFEKVTADSRCPMGVECITAGKADLVLRVGKDGAAETINLSFTLPNGTSNVTEFKGHTIRVVGVTPFKIKDREINPEEYILAITVTETPPPPVQMKLGDYFMLGVGDGIVLEDDPEYRLRFDSLASDSRCPEGVQCIWAGRVDAVFSVQKGNQTQVLRLATGDLSQGGSSAGAFGPYTLEFKAITPPKTQAPILLRLYKASLVIKK